MGGGGSVGSHDRSCSGAQRFSLASHVLGQVSEASALPGPYHRYSLWARRTLACGCDGGYLGRNV